MRLLFNPEVLRRLALVAGLFTAIIFFLNPTAFVYTVKLPDFAKIQKHGFVSEKDRNLSLEQFIDKRIDGRLREVSGPEWEAVVRGFLDHRQGRTPEEWQGNQPRLSKGPEREFYFGPGQQPFAEVSPGPGKVIYLGLDYEGSRHYLLLNPKRPKYARDAPPKILYPLRAYAWIPLALGFVLYFLLPRVKRPRGSLGYLRLWGLIVSDLMGLAFAGFFFAFPLGMILKKGGGLWSLFDFERGWAWLTIIMWLLTGFGLTMMAIGVWYRNFWITLTPKGLIRHTHRGEEVYDYSGMARASLSPKNHHWLVGALLAVGGNNPTAVGQAAILASQNHIGISLELKEGKPLWIRLEAFEDPQRLVRTLKENGVRLSSELESIP